MPPCRCAARFGGQGILTLGPMVSSFFAKKLKITSFNIDIMKLRK
jgi:hypothetical protein